MQYPEIVNQVYSQISQIPQPNPFPQNKDWILSILYRCEQRRLNRFTLNKMAKSVIDFALEYSPIDDWDIDLENYNFAIQNQQNKWLEWREGLEPVDPVMKKTIDDEREF